MPETTTTEVDTIPGKHTNLSSACADNVHMLMVAETRFNKPVLQKLKRVHFLKSNIQSNILFLIGTLRNFFYFYSITIHFFWATCSNCPWTRP